MMLAPIACYIRSHNCESVCLTTYPADCVARVCPYAMKTILYPKQVMLRLAH